MRLTRPGRRTVTVVPPLRGFDLVHACAQCGRTLCVSASVVSVPPTTLPSPTPASSSSIFSDSCDESCSSRGRRGSRGSDDSGSLRSPRRSAPSPHVFAGRRGHLATVQLPLLPLAGEGATADTSAVGKPPAPTSCRGRRSAVDSLLARPDAARTRLGSYSILPQPAPRPATHRVRRGTELDHRSAGGLHGPPRRLSLCLSAETGVSSIHVEAEGPASSRGPVRGVAEAKGEEEEKAPGEGKDSGPPPFASGPLPAPGESTPRPRFDSTNSDGGGGGGDQHLRGVHHRPVRPRSATSRGSPPMRPPPPRSPESGAVGGAAEDPGGAAAKGAGLYGTHTSPGSRAGLPRPYSGAPTDRPPASQRLLVLTDPAGSATTTSSSPATHASRHVAGWREPGAPLPPPPRRLQGLEGARTQPRTPKALKIDTPCQPNRLLDPIHRPGSGSSRSRRRSTSHGEAGAGEKKPSPQDAFQGRGRREAGRLPRRVWPPGGQPPGLDRGRSFWDDADDGCGVEDSPRPAPSRRSPPSAPLPPPPPSPGGSRSRVSGRTRWGRRWGAGAAGKAKAPAADAGEAPAPHRTSSGPASLLDRSETGGAGGSVHADGASDGNDDMRDVLRIAAATLSGTGQAPQPVSQPVPQPAPEPAEAAASCAGPVPGAGDREGDPVRVRRGLHHSMGARPSPSRDAGECGGADPGAAPTSDRLARSLNTALVRPGSADSQSSWVSEVMDTATAEDFVEPGWPCTPVRKAWRKQFSRFGKKSQCVPAPPTCERCNSPCRSP